MSADLDCQKCGLCCFAWAWNGSRRLPFIELGPREAVRIAKKYPKLVVIDDTPPTGMAFKDPNSLTIDVKNGRCAALRGVKLKNMSCSIYEDRPSACRNFKRGGALCLSIRARKGL